MQAEIFVRTIAKKTVNIDDMPYSPFFFEVNVYIIVLYRCIHIRHLQYNPTVSIKPEENLQTTVHSREAHEGKAQQACRYKDN